MCCRLRSATASTCGSRRTCSRWSGWPRCTGCVASMRDGPARGGRGTGVGRKPEGRLCRLRRPGSPGVEPRGPRGSVSGRPLLPLGARAAGRRAPPPSAAPRPTSCSPPRPPARGGADPARPPPPPGPGGPPPANLEFEPTPIGGWLPADPGRLAAARAIRLDPGLRPAFLAQGAAQANLERLLDGALCVTTGQQPGLFTGPLFTLHKALTTVALAREATVSLGHAVVPVFWVAGDDHDFAEGNQAHVLTASNDVEHLVLRERDASAPLTPLYREPVGDDIARLLDVLRVKLPETEFRSGVLEWLERHYRPDTDLASAFARAVSDLLGPLGLVVFQPTHPAAKRAMAPWLLRVLEAAAALNDALVATAEDLQRAGRPAPVTVGDGATMVMIEIG